MITYKDIEAAVKPLEKIDVKGKAYVQVAERIKAFRTIWPTGAISTEIVSHERISDNVFSLIMRATVADENGKVLATGTAWERSDSSYINKTSYFENCETSAVGRALGFIALGVDAGMASADELANAITQQAAIKKREQYAGDPEPKAPPATEPPTHAKIAKEWCKAQGISTESFGNHLKIAQQNGVVPEKKLNDMSDDEFNNLLKWVSANT